MDGCVPVDEQVIVNICLHGMSNICLFSIFEIDGVGQAYQRVCEKDFEA